MSKRIGMIGVGVMGRPMAKLLAAKYDSVVVFDVDPNKTEWFARQDIKVASTLAEVGTLADIVILSLPASDVVKNVVLGKEALISSLTEGSIVVDTSTTDPTLTRQMALKLAVRGISFLDAPVSGGEKGAIEGTLSVMVGGDEDVFDKCKEVLQTFGASVIRVGDSGMGQVCKLVNQMIVGATFAVIAEGFALGVKSGLKAKTLYEAIKGGWAGSKVLDVSAAAIIKHDFTPGGTVDIHYKDLGYALAVSKHEVSPMPVTAIVHEIFKAAKAAEKGKLSQPAIITLWEQIMGIKVNE
ncbi:MAG: NAD(P)-binding domain-containing protein [Gammaproteobacteria bacterium]|jgi:2-hydroxy-3-oxopropionate reductase|nr:NAD(P)-binding domain-containing protein [Gammaproteobacteria bacterium]